MKRTTICVLALMLGGLLRAQTLPEGVTNAVRILPGESTEAVIAKASHVSPSGRQLAWQELEFTVFIHFGINTFANVEWGRKDDSASLFNPSQLDARQWAQTAKLAGAKLLLAVAKHHDGFCLWPSRYTDFSVRQSPWKHGSGDVIAEISAACREYGLKFGVYLSPWDIHSRLYGTPEYNDHFKNQLRELLTNYGEIAEVWFDGACGEGPNGKKQEYDWEGFYSLIRELRPNAVIAVMGPDVRWVGTESGYGRETEWSVVPAPVSALEQIARTSQQKPGTGAFVPPGDMTQQDLGSRDKIAHASGLIWYPSEVDVSIRPGWFYHAAEDSLVKSPEKLVDIYYSSLGRNSLLLLNLPPDKRGLIHENDVASLKGMRVLLDSTFKSNLAATAKVTVPDGDPNMRPEEMLDNDPRTFWTPGGDVLTPSIELDFGYPRVFDCLLLQEHISNGQRVERFVLEAKQDGRWEEVARGTTIGYKRLMRFAPVRSAVVRLRILSSRGAPEISSFGLFRSPVQPH